MYTCTSYRLLVKHDVALTLIDESLVVDDKVVGYGYLILWITTQQSALYVTLRHATFLDNTHKCCN